MEGPISESPINNMSMDMPLPSTSNVGDITNRELYACKRSDVAVLLGSWGAYIHVGGKAAPSGYVQDAVDELVFVGMHLPMNRHAVAR